MRPITSTKNQKIRFGSGFLLVRYPNPGGAALSENISNAVLFRNSLNSKS